MLEYLDCLGDVLHGLDLLHAGHLGDAVDLVQLTLRILLSYESSICFESGFVPWRALDPAKRVELGDSDQQIVQLGVSIPDVRPLAVHENEVGSCVSQIIRRNTISLPEYMIMG